VFLEGIPCRVRPPPARVERGDGIAAADGQRRLAGQPRTVSSGTMADSGIRCKRARYGRHGVRRGPGRRGCDHPVSIKDWERWSDATTSIPPRLEAPREPRRPARAARVRPAHRSPTIPTEALASLAGQAPPPRRAGLALAAARPQCDVIMFAGARRLATRCRRHVERLQPPLVLSGTHHESPA